MTRSWQSRDLRVLARCRVEFDRLDRKISAESEDLSRRGVFVRTDELLPVGHETEIVVRLPDGAAISVLARVVHLLTPSAARALGRHVGMGLAFVDLDHATAAIDAYLDAVIEGLAPKAVQVPASVRVVVAEPSLPLRERITAALSEAGFTVDPHPAGETAYAAMLERTPEALVTAARMDGMDGAALVRACAIHAQLATVPVVMVSDDPSDLSRLEMLRLGVHHYVLRPFVDEELVLRVRRATSTAPGSPGPGTMLRGDLAEISVATLLSLFEFERKSGIMMVVSGGLLARVFVATGRVVKVDAAGDAPTPRARLMTVLDWEHGTFEFSGCEVSGHDEIGLPTTQLLLEHARDRDERLRNAESQ